MQEMRALHGNLLLIWPRSAEFSLRADQKSSWISINKELWYGAAGHPACVRIDNLSDVLRLSLYWQFPRPCQHRLSRRTGDPIVPAIYFHGFLMVEPPRIKLDALIVRQDGKIVRVLLVTESRVGSHFGPGRSTPATWSVRALTQSQINTFFKEAVTLSSFCTTCTTKRRACPC